jgi:hypothetical protein
MDIFIYTCVYLRIYVCVCVRAYMYINTCMYIYTYICMYVCMYSIDTCCDSVQFFFCAYKTRVRQCIVMISHMRFGTLISSGLALLLHLLPCATVSWLQYFNNVFWNQPWLHARHEARLCMCTCTQEKTLTRRSFHVQDGAQGPAGAVGPAGPAGGEHRPPFPLHNWCCVCELCLLPCSSLHTCTQPLKSR